MRIYTLSNPLHMEKEARIPDNRLAPAAIVFATRAEAEAFMAANLPSRKVYELVIEGTFEEFTTRDGAVSAAAYHQWHIDHDKRRSKQCGVCMGWKPNHHLAADALVHEALIVNPDTNRLS